MKNIKNYIIHEDDDIQPMPSKVGIRWNIDKTGKRKDSWDDKWEKTHHNDKYFSYCDRIDALLKKSIGLPFADVYSKVCNEFPTLYDYGKSLKDYFNDQFRPWRWRHRISDHYYVDENGLIQHYAEEYPRKRRPGIVIYNHDRQPEYRVNRDAVMNNDTFMNYIYYRCGQRIYYTLLDSDVIPEKLYDEILQKTDYDHRVKEIIDRYVWKWEWNKGDPGYKQIKAEHDAFKRKEKREREKLAEEQRENLLHYLEAQKKQRDLEKDIISRDRHGFDEESFKGEFYHGQKRKKRED